MASERTMLIDVYRDSKVPIYEQIVAQVQFRVASGTLEPGDRIPSVRELSQQLSIAPGTVARAFLDLEKAGVLVTRPGVGMEITHEAVALCRRWRQQIVRDRIRDALREAVSSALSAEEIRQLVEEELNHINGKARPGGKRL
jgi:GntR family transcriptional regulator